MASSVLASSAFLLLLNLLLFSPVSCHYVPKCPPTPKPKPPFHPSPPTPHHPSPQPPSHPSPQPPSHPSPQPPQTPPYTPSPPQTPPSYPTSPPPAYKDKCPRDALKLGVCANVLGDLVHLVVGTPPKTPCCTLIKGLADLEAAVCLCTAIKANVLGINLNVPLSLSLLLNYCGKGVPSGFQCP